MSKVVHVHLIYQRRDYYFGSISAIYDHLTSAEVGITKSSLLHAGLGNQGVKMTAKAVIRVSELLRSKNKG